MVIEAALKEMVNGIDGGLAGIIIGRDGIAVENYVREGRFYDIDAIAAEYSKMIKEVKKASLVSDITDIDEVTVSAGDSNIFIKLINGDYFIALITDGSEIFGKARFFLDKSVSKIAKEF